MHKVAPAIAAGNTVVCKPPHQNPLSNLKLAEVYDLLPAGVVNVLTGAADTATALVEDPYVDLIAFTGSNAVGRKIAAAAGAQLKKVNLELGPVDPFIVFKDADLDAAVPGVAWARLLNAGQVCTSSKRVYVERPIAAEFTERMLKFVALLKVGNPMARDTDIGPLISHEAARRVEDQVARAVKDGATLGLGGGMSRPAGLPGHFFQPTILTDVRHGSLATREEIFGPVLSITTVADADEAAPFGGMRHSGIGRELGAEGLDAFREPKHVHLDWVMERKPWFFPYRDRKP
jgi:betaine-aldehyde dehydrogenase